MAPWGSLEQQQVSGGPLSRPTWRPPPLDPRRPVDASPLLSPSPAAAACLKPSWDLRGRRLIAGEAATRSNKTGDRQDGKVRASAEICHLAR